MRAAIYARVSTERQERQQTIDSQLSALRGWVSAQGHVLADAHVFRDEGFSGSRLDRPALDALRDAIRDSVVDVVAVFSPDRLARKYAYQVLLMEEFRRAGCEVVFLHHPISDDPNDQLLLQIQGAIAEYERAVLAERFRRGKLQKARDGNIISAKVPYGYRYEGRCGAVPARLIVDEAEASMVRQLYAWVVDEGLTIRQCIKRLNVGPWVTRSGRRQWSSSVVHHILTDPVYIGTAYANRFDYVVPKRPRRRSRRSTERSCRRPRPPEQWIAIPAPPLVDQQSWDCVRAALARNAALSFRRNKKHDYLLRCLLKCGRCGLGIHGCYFPGQGGRPGRRYYRCAGTDPLTTGREAKCPRARIEANGLEQAIWDHVVSLLEDPAQVLAQFERFVAQAASDGEDNSGSQLRTRIERLNRADRRLLEAYQAEVISLEELSGQRKALAEQRQLAEQQHEQRLRLREQQLQAQEVLVSLTAFTQRVGSRLHTTSIAERQAILQLVVERIIVHDDNLEIQHVIPLQGHTPGNGSPSKVGLCSDGVRPARNLDDRPGLGPRRIIQPSKPGITIRLKKTGEARHVCRRMRSTAIKTVEIGGSRSHRSAKQPVVADIDPQPSGCGSPEPRCQHRNGRVIAVDLIGCEDMFADCCHDRVEQPCRLADPVTQGRAIEFNALSRIDLALAIQRQVIAVLRYQQMCERGRGGAPARRRHRRCRGLRDRIAGGASIFRPNVPDHLEVAGHVVQNFGDVFTQFGHALAAVRTAASAILGRLMHHLLARQMLRQRLALWLGPLADGGYGICNFSLSFRNDLGLARLQFLKPQFKLLDLAADPLRRTAKLHASQLGNLELQLLDLQRLVLNREFRHLQLALAGQGEDTQFIRIGGQCGRGERHGQTYQDRFGLTRLVSESLIC
jgi:site-specific DNA recombinase